MALAKGVSGAGRIGVALILHDATEQSRRRIMHACVCMFTRAASHFEMLLAVIVWGGAFCCLLSSMLLRSVELLAPAVFPGATPLPALPTS